jgi:RND family efflux transporter MFP subunit
MSNFRRHILQWGAIGVHWWMASTEGYAQTVMVPAETREVVATLDSVGKVVPAVSADISPARDMVIEKFLVSPGDTVKKGQKLAEISMKSVAQELKFLKPYGDVLRQNVQLSKINMEVAEQKLERTAILADKGIVKSADLDRAKGEAGGYRRSYESSLAQLADIEGKIKEVNKQLDEIALVSPLDGFVAQMAVDPKQLSGAYSARAGSLLMRIDQPGSYLMQVKMSDRDFLRLKEFPDCQVRLPHTNPIPCKILPPIGVPERSPQSVAALFPVEARFEFTMRKIPKGLESKLHLSAKTAQKRLLIPWNAVDVEPGKTFARKKVGDKIERVPVNLGWRDAFHVEVLDGLASGDLVEAKVWPPMKSKT